jgi:hypothetical protein
MTTNTRHGEIVLDNGTIVCKCGAGNDPESLPFYGGIVGEADNNIVTRSLEAYGDHIVAVAAIA